jgi:hypothetical protein
MTREESARNGGMGMTRIRWELESQRNKVIKLRSAHATIEETSSGD